MDKVIQHISSKYTFFRDIAIKIAKSEELGQDLLQSCILYVYDKYNPVKFNKALEEGYIDYLFINVLKTECWSKHSYFYREYLKFNDNHSEMVFNNELDEEFDYEKHYYNQSVVSLIKKILVDLEANGTIKWWEKEVFEMYHFAEEKISYRDMKKDTKICESSLFNAIHKVDKYLRIELDKQLKII